MSGATQPSSFPVPDVGAAADCLRSAADRLRAAAAGGVRAAAFWSAVLLPAVYLPAASVLDGPAGLLPACLALNAGCAALGHDYRAGGADARGERNGTDDPDATADGRGGDRA